MTPDGVYEIIINDDSSVTVKKDGGEVSVVKPVLAEISKKFGFKLDTSWNTRQLGAKLVDFLKSQPSEPKATKAAAAEENRYPLHIRIESKMAKVLGVANNLTEEILCSSPSKQVELSPDDKLYVNDQLIEGYFNNLFSEPQPVERAIVDLSGFVDKDTPLVGLSIFEASFLNATIDVHIDLKSAEFNPYKLKFGIAQDTLVFDKMREVEYEDPSPYVTGIAYDDGPYYEVEVTTNGPSFGRKIEDAITIPDYLVYAVNKKATIIEDINSETKKNYVSCENVIKEIGQSSFAETYIYGVYNVRSLRKIGKWAFFLSTLSVIDLAECSNLQTIGESAFSQTFLKKLEIPDSVKELEYGVVSHMEYLRELTIGKSVKKLEGIYDMKRLKVVTFRRDTPPKMDEVSFTETPDDVKVIVPKGSLKAYKAVKNLSRFNIVVAEE